MLWRILFVICAFTFVVNGVQIVAQPTRCADVSIGHQGSGRYGSVVYSCYTAEEMAAAKTFGVDLGFTMPGLLGGLASIVIGLVAIAFGSWPLPRNFYNNVIRKEPRWYFD